MKALGTKKWQKTNNATAAAFSPYKPFKQQIDGAVKDDGRGTVLAAWLGLRSVVRATVNADAPKWGGMDDTALGKRIGMKNLAWAHVADAWGTNLGNVAFLLDTSDPHYAAVRASALAFRAAVTGQIPGSLNAPPMQANTVLNALGAKTAKKIEAALLIAVNGGE
jgi:hypothetical protein